MDFLSLYILPFYHYFYPSFQSLRQVYTRHLSLRVMAWHVVATHKIHAVFGDGGILYRPELRKRIKANGRLAKHLYVAPSHQSNSSSSVASPV